MFRLLGPWIGSFGVYVVLAVFVVIILSVSLHRFYFAVLPQWAIKKYERTAPSA